MCACLLSLSCAVQYRLYIQRCALLIHLIHLIHLQHCHIFSHHFHHRADPTRLTFLLLYFINNPTILSYPILSVVAVHLVGVAVHSRSWLFPRPSLTCHAPSWLRSPRILPPPPTPNLHRSFYQPRRCTPTRGHPTHLQEA